MGLPDDLNFRTMWDVALIERRAGRDDASLALLTRTGGGAQSLIACAPSRKSPSTTSTARRTT